MVVIELNVKTFVESLKAGSAFSGCFVKLSKEASKRISKAQLNGGFILCFDPTGQIKISINCFL